MEVRLIETIPLSYSLGDGRGFGGTRGMTHTRSAMLVRLETADGTVGWGEALAPPRSASAVVDEVLSDRVRGMSPYDAETLTADLYAGEYHFGRGPLVHSAASAVDIALWDIRGKAAGRPVSDLLGMSDASAFFEDDNPSEVVPYASTMYVTEWGEDPADPMEAAVDEGFEAAKIKIGRGISDDVERVSTAREILGDDAYLMVDFNGNYRPKQAVKAAAALEPYDITWIEEPVPPENRTGYTELKRYTDIPLAAGEAHFNRFEFKQLLDDGCVDILQPNITRCGGFSEARFLAKLAATENVAVRPHVWNGGVGMAAALQFAASIPTYPHAGSAPEPKLFEVDRSDNPLRDEILSTPFDFTGGTLSVPRGPGLGIDVDETAVERYRLE